MPLFKMLGYDGKIVPKRLSALREWKIIHHQFLKIAHTHCVKARVKKRRELVFMTAATHTLNRERLLFLSVPRLSSLTGNIAALLS
jgi:hypothetical protein